MPGYGAALLDKALDIQEDAFADFADFWGPMVGIVMRQSQDDVESARGRVDVLLGRWQESMTTSDEVLEFSKFVESNYAILSQLRDPSSLLRTVAIDVLRRDIESLLDNHVDEEADHGWLGQVESVAEDLGIAEEMRAEIESANDSISQYYRRDKDDDWYPRVAPTSGAGFGRPAQASINRDQVDAMFGQLG